MRHAAAVASLLAALPLASCSGWKLETAREERHLSASIGAGRAIRVDTQNGGVEIVSDPSLSAVAIKADVRGAAPTVEEARVRLAEIEIVAENVDGGDLAISLVFPDGKARNNEGCDFEIRTPGATGVTVSTGNGPVRIEGLGGFADLLSSNGPITVMRHDGAVHADTSNGRITVENASGEADLSSSNGRIEVTGARAKVTARTSNGDIEFKAASGFSAPFHLDTSNGDVTVSLPPGASVDVSASTSNGAVSTEGSPMSVSGRRNSKRIRVGEGAHPSSVDTSNGHVTVAVVGREAELPQ